MGAVVAYDTEGMQRCKGSVRGVGMEKLKLSRQVACRIGPGSSSRVMPKPIYTISALPPARPLASTHISDDKTPKKVDKAGGCTTSLRG
jgi:hypothetical protein